MGQIGPWVRISRALEGNILGSSQTLARKMVKGVRAVQTSPCSVYSDLVRPQDGVRYGSESRSASAWICSTTSAVSFEYDQSP